MARYYEEDPTPVLMLEALVLDNGTWEGLGATKRRTMSINGSSAILLWSKPCLWYSPLPEYKLLTALGILRLTLDVLPPNRVHIQVAYPSLCETDGQGQDDRLQTRHGGLQEGPFPDPKPQGCILLAARHLVNRTRGPGHTRYANYPHLYQGIDRTRTLNLT